MRTLQAGSYTVTYSAADKAGNVGYASRTVTVVNPCASPEHFCTSTCRSGWQSQAYMYPVVDTFQVHLSRKGTLRF